MSARSLAESLSHRFVFPRRLPARFSHKRIYVSTEAGLRYLGRRTDRLDPPLFDIASRYVNPGDTVWDIGGNVGLFTFAAAAVAGPSGRLLTVEPDPWLARLLQRSAAANPEPAVEVMCAAVGASFGLAQFHIARRSRSTNYLEGFGTTQTGGSRASMVVPLVPLDALLEHSRPDLVKIDVEEAEVDVLQGAPRVLSECRPVIVCEVGESHRKTVTDLLVAQHGYELFDADAGFVQRSSAPYATVAVPAERAQPTLAAVT